MDDEMYILERFATKYTGADQVKMGYDRLRKYEAALRWYTISVEEENYKGNEIPPRERDFLIKTTELKMTGDTIRHSTFRIKSGDIVEYFSHCIRFPENSHGTLEYSGKATTLKTEDAPGKSKEAVVAILAEYIEALARKHGLEVPQRRAARNVSRETSP